MRRHSENRDQSASATRDFVLATRTLSLFDLDDQIASRLSNEVLPIQCVYIHFLIAGLKE